VLRATGQAGRQLSAQSVGRRGLAEPRALSIVRLMDELTRHRVRFGAALANAASQSGAVCIAVLLLVLVVGVTTGLAIDAEDLTLLVGVFGGAFVLTSLGMAISQRFDWFRVDVSGLAYRVSGGLGSARLLVKKTGEAPWDVITEVTPSRFLPHRILHLTIERPGPGGASREEFLELPLYLCDEHEFLRGILSYAPEGHPLRVALSPVAP
jgi:hypothetical protein